MAGIDPVVDHPHVHRLAHLLKKRRNGHVNGQAEVVAYKPRANKSWGNNWGVGKQTGVTMRKSASNSSEMKTGSKKNMARVQVQYKIPHRTIPVLFC